MESGFFSFDGRIGRQTWWMRMLALMALNIANTIIFGSKTGILLAVFLVIWGVALWVSLATNAQRLHDRNKSGWLSLIVYVPMGIANLSIMTSGTVGGLYLLTIAIGGFASIWLLIETGFLSGTPGPNEYGPELGSAQLVAA